MPVQPAYASRAAESADLIKQGAKLFLADFTPEQGLGPLFNQRSCVVCHGIPTAGGMGWEGLGSVYRVGRIEDGWFAPLLGAGGPVARDHSIAEFGVACDLVAGPPAAANLVSVRNAPPLYGLGLIDAIPDAVIRAGAAARTGGTKGRVNIVRDAAGNERVGRFGWKSDTATLEQFVGDAFRNELGITNPIAPTDLVEAGSGCGGPKAALDDDGTAVRMVTAFIASLPPPRSTLGPQHRAGEILFSNIGCAACHTPALSANGFDVPLYSDLLLHDLGPALDDRVLQAERTGKEWRTPPLWGLGMRGRLLHDGRATNVPDAIRAHDGEAATSMRAFRQLGWHDQAALVAFLLAL